MSRSRPAKTTDGRSVRAERIRKQRRNQVLDAARAVFSQSGYHQTSISDIIDAAGIARGTFYLYFESKRAIFDELLDNLFALLTKAVRRIDTSPTAPPPLAQMHSIVERLLETLMLNRDLARILLREAVGLDADFDQKLADFYGKLLGLIRDAIGTGQRMGLVRSCDPELAAYCVLGSVKELVDRLVVQTPEDLRLDLVAVSREIVEFNLSGLFRRENTG